MGDTGCFSSSDLAMLIQQASYFRGTQVMKSWRQYNVMLSDGVKCTVGEDMLTHLKLVAGITNLSVFTCLLKVADLKKHEV